MRSGGFTLTESLIALAIMGIALAAILPTFLTYADTNDLSEERSGAVAAAQEIMEGLRQADPVSLPSTGSSAPQLVAVGQREYEVVASFCTDIQYCGLDSRHILIEVSHGGRTIYTVESVYTQLR